MRLESLVESLPVNAEGKLLAELPEYVFADN